MENSVLVVGATNEGAGESSPGSRRLIPLALVLVLTLAAVLTAVLSSSSPASGSTAVRAALDSMVKAKSVTFALNLNLSGTTSAQASMDGSCATGPECQVTFQASSGASSIGESQLVLDHGEAYVELGAPIAQQLPTPWVSTPLHSSSAPQSTGFSGTENFASLLAGFTKAGDTVTDDGTVALNGQVTHEYSISASASTEQQQFDAMIKALPTADLSVLGSVTVGGFQVNIYVGPDGNIAQVDLSTSLTTSQGAESLSLTLALSHYGQPVSVTAPPANEVTPLSSLLTSLPSGL